LGEWVALPWEAAVRAWDPFNSFIHSGYFYSALKVNYYSEALPTTALILCRSQYAEALQVTVNDRLAQGPDSLL